MSEYNLGDVRFFIDHDNRILYMERHDNLTKEGIYAEWHAMQQLDGFDPSYETIVDYSNVPYNFVELSDIKEINSDIPKHDPRTSHVAIITGYSDSRYMLAKFFCTIANLIYSRKHQVFKAKDDAEAWIFSLRK